MRVTASTFPNSLIDQLNRLAIRQNTLQQQAATGQKLTRPDDDPVAMRRVMDMQADARSVEQFERNIARNQELAAASFAPIKSLKGVVDRASEIATLADGLRSPEELRAYAAEVNELIQQGVQLMNSQSRGDYIFSGTRADTPPFAMTRDAAGLVTSVVYQGNTQLAENEVGSGITLAAQSLGANDTGTGPRGLVADSRAGADLFNHLIALRDQLTAGDTGTIADVTRGELQKDEDNLIFHLGSNGAVQARLEAVAGIMNNRRESAEMMISREADADLAQTLVRLSEVQTAYQAALQSGGSILNRSLMDYLR